MSVFIELAIGDSDTDVSLAGADAIAAAAQELGATGIRLVDHTDGRRILDPSVTGAYLAGRHGRLTYLVDVPTTRNAPFNVARRVLSFDRATDGRVGVVLRPGVSDEVSQATAPDGDTADQAARWAEYAEIINRLWESFPRSALIGDQDAAIVADDTRIRPIDHDGRFYRVAGPLDGPSSVQGRPALVVDDPAEIGWVTVAAVADAVIVDGNTISDAEAALTAALGEADRPRSDIALLARVTVDHASAVSTRLPGDAVDGIVLVPTTGDTSVILDLVRTVVAQLSPRAGGTLRSALGLRDVAEALV
jgi:alkanesulfonate monooxygenase SsuD/methylene tetrahydromethanopterin reductase-like flavin-dependent oxidoreductase (luciferase family)